MKPYYTDSHCAIYHGDCEELLPTLGRFDIKYCEIAANRLRQGVFSFAEAK